MPNGLPDFTDEQRQLRAFNARHADRLDTLATRLMRVNENLQLDTAPEGQWRTKPAQNMYVPHAAPNGSTQKEAEWLGRQCGVDRG